MTDPKATFDEYCECQYCQAEVHEWSGWVNALRKRLAEAEKLLAEIEDGYGWQFSEWMQDRLEKFLVNKP